MERPRDTSPDALDRQRDALRRRSPNERLATAHRLSDEVRALAEEGVRRRSPTLSESQVQAEVRAIVERAANRSERPSRG